jgi:hypothetical protein
MVELYLNSPLRLHGVMLNELNTGTTLPFIFTFIAFRLVLSLKQPPIKWVKEACLPEV